ncbi:ADP-ribosylhydrolase ARH1-like [Mytilus californianus]|uniref:ADP-ribosylhydrolase ARH1-like n=1 Tax=Mytilus californianus TaxID=6549 RepID=UPI002245BCB9|nr:ADP-ribosylhydrolase ARH1-like [Mytilus californianus]
MADPILERYVAAMVLSGVGDAMGYKNGSWEFCQSGIDIHQEAEKLGGIENLKIELPNWMVSDDTVLHLATAEAYMETKDTKDKETLYKHIAEKYKKGMDDMDGRAPGRTTMNSCHMLNPLQEKGYEIPFNPRGRGCGAAMRAMCIGLRYPKPENLSDLIADGIESGRMTHHNPTGFLGSLAAALFTSYAIQNKPVEQWGAGLMDTLPLARKYIQETGRAVNENLKEWGYFENAWTNYLETRNITSGKSLPKFPSDYGIEARDKFYESVSSSGWGGANGHDAPMIAYDAMLGSGDSWIEICKRGILHYGDNDSTGVMAGCWFGAMYGLLGVPDNHHKKLEYRKRLEEAGEKLYKLAHKGKEHQSSSIPCQKEGNGETDACNDM